MISIKKLSILVLFLTLTLRINAQQETLLEREGFAVDMFEVGEYELAIETLEELIHKGHHNAYIQYYLGLSYMELYDPEDALPYLIEAKKQGFNASKSRYLKKDRYNKNYYSFDIDFALARGYHLKGQYAQAIKSYQNYLSNTDGIGITEKEITELYQKQCLNGLEMEKKQERVRIINLGDRINSPYDEFGALVSMDTSNIIFTRKAPNRDPKSVNIDGSFKEDIYITYRRKDGKWMVPFRISMDINDDKKNDFAAALFDNDKKLLVNYEGGKLVRFDKVGTTWQNVKKSTEEVQAQAITEQDGVMIISTSLMNGKGGLDLFLAVKDDKGEYGKFINMGELINTPYDECFPFIDPISKTLYFSSNGDKSCGSYDVFKADYNPINKTWGAPVNLSLPINTPRDDIYFTFHGDKKVAYYNSERKGGLGGLDIYVVDYNQDKVKVIDVVFKIRTTDTIPRPIKTDMFWIEKETNLKITLDTDEKGIVKTKALQGKEYQLQIFNPQYSSFDSVFKMTVDSVFEKIIYIDFLPEGKKYVLSNVQFERDMSKILTEGYTELNRFYEFLNKNPNLSIEIAGHTELGGLDSKNKVLSQERADAVKDYLVRKGVNPKRMLAVGYGSRFPLTKGNSEAEKSMNRRTEIILHHPTNETETWRPSYEKN